jgi:hypothetical protein
MKYKSNYLNYFVILDLKTKDLSLIKQNEIKEMLGYSQTKIYDNQYTYFRKFYATRTPNRIYGR